jgi:O-succinylbenzoic acid--CoA ligase
VLLAGPVLARGYRRTRDGTPDAFSTDARGRRRLRTDDLGSVDGDGRLTVLGRADDVVVTGGLKVAPRPVEEALLAMPGVAEAAVVGAADAQWGQRVVAVLVPDPGGTAPTDTAVREHVAATVAAHAAPHQVLRLDALPLRGPGKPDRAALARIADAQWPQEG